ncbi:MAG: hypothetical protein WAZ12_00685 [Candidatus Absconditicoccaceae bacterium]
MLKDGVDMKLGLDDKEINETKNSINNIDFLIETVREELFDNNSESNRKRLEELKQVRNNLINKKEKMEKD